MTPEDPRRAVVVEFDAPRGRRHYFRIFRHPTGNSAHGGEWWAGRKGWLPALKDSMHFTSRYYSREAAQHRADFLNRYLTVTTETDTP